jgi:hypothetical protein
MKGHFYLFLLTSSTFIGSCQLIWDKECPIHAEKDGYVEVEAEDFCQQDSTSIRQWYLIDEDYDNSILPDGDANHSATASKSAYLEILPDTRRTYTDPLIPGVNFSNEPGMLAILHYKVKFKNTGKYYVWVRAYSTGTEDNGLHVGLNGEWVESGQRMQWCEGKEQWTWASKQRVPEQHCGIEKRIFLEIKEPGIHTISFSMREDGFEFDKWVLNKEYHY